MAFDDSLYRLKMTACTGFGFKPAKALPPVVKCQDTASGVGAASNATWSHGRWHKYFHLKLMRCLFKFCLRSSRIGSGQLQGLRICWWWWLLIQGQQKLQYTTKKGATKRLSHHHQVKVPASPGCAATKPKTCLGGVQWTSLLLHFTSWQLCLWQ